MLRLITSTSAAARLAAAAHALTTRLPSEEILVIGASRGAADDLTRAVTRRAGATFGVIRFSLTELAARAAAVQLAGPRRAPGSQAAAEAIAARAVFEARAADELEYFAPVAALPGFPKALARTTHELRLGQVDADRLDAAGAAGADLRRLLARIDEQRGRAGVDDRAALFAQASRAWRSGRVRWAAMPVVLLDVTIDSRAERDFIAAIAAAAPDLLAAALDVAAVRDPQHELAIDLDAWLRQEVPWTDGSLPLGWLLRQVGDALLPDRMRQKTPVVTEGTLRSQAVIDALGELALCLCRLAEATMGADLKAAVEAPPAQAAQ